MLAVIAVVYLLLALRVRIALEGAICGTGGNLALSAGAAGVYIRFDGTAGRKKNSIFPALIPRYAAKARKKKTKEMHGKLQRIAGRYLWFAKAGKMERLAIQIRLGLGDAGETAVAAGVLRALISGALANVKRDAQMECSVFADSGSVSFAAYVRCIFSCQLGDIMLAAIRAALKKKHKSRGEGLSWKSIPLKA